MKRTDYKETENLSNHIEEYFSNQNTNKDVLTSKELFKANKEDVDIKTELTDEEIVILNVIKVNQDDLIKRGIKDVYDTFINGFLRLKISRERKSRGEFVDMNKGNNNDTASLSDTINKLSGNVIGAKK